MSATPWTRGRVAIVATAALLLLAGCTPTSPTPVASPTSASASPTPTIEPVSAPEPHIDLTCADLAVLLPLEDSLVTAVTERSSAQADYSRDPIRPDEYIVRSVGGFVCEFNNGQPEYIDSGFNPAYVGVRVIALPEPGAGWEEYIQLVAESSDRRIGCNDIDGVTSCSGQALSANRGVEVYLTGAVSEAAGTALADAAVAAVTNAPPAAPEWTIPAGTLALPNECETYITGAAVQAITGQPTAFTVISVLGGLGGYSLRLAAEELNGSPSCFMKFELDDSGVGSLRVLRGGEWAWAEAQTLVDSTPITVAGLGPDDQAWLRCAPADANCVVDLVVGGNWIELYLSSIQTEVPFDRRAAIQEMAATVVANVVP